MGSITKIITCAIDAIAGITLLAKAIKWSICVDANTIIMAVMYVFSAFVDIYDSKCDTQLNYSTVNF